MVKYYKNWKSVVPIFFVYVCIYQFVLRLPFLLPIYLILAIFSKFQISAGKDNLIVKGFLKSK